MLYLGDSAAAEQEGHLREAAWLFSDDQAESVASVHPLAQRSASRRGEVRALAFGHSGPWPDASPLLEVAR